MSKVTQANEDYFFEEDRLKSFTSWPFNDDCECNIKKMAEAGFYWIGNEKEGDTVSCFMCNKILDGWESTDDPWSEHKKHAPQCAFLKLRRPEQEISVAEIFNLFEIKLKNDLTRKYNERKTKLMKVVQKKREVFCGH